MPFELQHVRGFLAVAEQGTIGQAARELGWAQPVLSRVIRSLERHLDAELFSRHAHGVELTETGGRFLLHARLLAAEAEDAMDAIADLRGLRGGVIKIGAMGSVLRSTLPRAIETLLRCRPGLTALVLDGPAEILVARLVQREIDLMVASDLIHTDEIKSLGPLDDGDLIEVVAGSGHPLAGRSEISPGELVDYPWVLSPRTTQSRQLLEDACAAAGIRIGDPVIEARSATSIKALLTSGRYLGWLSAPHYEAEAATGMLCRLNVPGFSFRRRFVLYCRRFGALPPPAQALVELLAAGLPDAQCTAASPSPGAAAATPR